MNNSLAIISPSSDLALGSALNALQETIYRAAERNLDEALAASPAPTNLTRLERTAIIEIEALKLTNGIDLAALLIRGRIIMKIREQNLLNVHPEHYATLAEMAAAQGISSAELSNTDTLCNTIFPYLEANGMSVAEVWHDVGKAKFFELVPVLSAVITGNMPGRGATRDAVEAILNSSAEALSGAGNMGADQEAIRADAVERLVEIGRTLPVRAMRRQLRPEGTPDIPAIIVRSGDMYFAVLQMDEDQRTMFRRLNENHLNETSFEATLETQPQLNVIRQMLGAS